MTKGGVGDDHTLFSVEEYKRVLPRIVLPRQKSAVSDAREFYGWTAHKLEILRVYLATYRRVAGSGTYIDGFAGTGTILVQGETQPGSVGVASASTAFKEFFLYELPSKARKLQNWIDSTISENRRSRFHVTGGDFNVDIMSDLESGRIPKDKPCFAFLDPDGTQLDWTTVEALARYKADCSPPDTCKVELWILVNTHQVLMRLMPRNGKQPQSATLNRWLGSETGWRDLYQNDRPPIFFALRYAARLEEEFGYGAARVMPICDPNTGRPQYHMIHASDHKGAHDIMRWASLHAGGVASVAVRLPGL